MAGKGSSSIRLLKLTEIDELDELEQIWLGDYRELEEILQHTNDNDQAIQTELHEKCQQVQGHTHMVQALLCGIICDRNRSQQFLRYLHLIVKDGYAVCVKQLEKLARDKFPKMNDRNAPQASQQQMQLLWVVREFVNLRVQGIDKVCSALLRQIQGGNVRSGTNRWLNTNLCMLFQESKSWLYEQTQLIPMVFYTFCRLAADHADPKYDKLRRMEGQICCDLFRDKFNECKVIGREAVRLLQQVCKIPEFEALWEDILNNPQQFGGMNDISDLFSVRTPKDFLQSRLTPQMEEQLLFIMERVTMGQQQRYQRWFMHKWGLTEPGGDALIPDLVRYICGFHHPSNEVLRSNLVQRWAVVGWLLKCAKTPTSVANIKLAMFYDWLFYSPRNDSVMNIEPAALLITRSIPKWLDITVDLMEFMFALADLWNKPSVDRCREGIFHAAADCVQKGVIKSWAQVSMCPQINPVLRARVRAQFKGFCHGDPEEVASEDIKAFGFRSSSVHGSTPAPSPGQSRSQHQTAEDEPLSPRTLQSSSSFDESQRLPSGSSTSSVDAPVVEAASSSNHSAASTSVPSVKGSESTEVDEETEHFSRANSEDVAKPRDVIEIPNILIDVSKQLKSMQEACSTGNSSMFRDCLSNVVKSVAHFEGNDKKKNALKAMGDVLLNLIEHEINGPLLAPSCESITKVKESNLMFLSFRILESISKDGEKSLQEAAVNIASSMQALNKKVSTSLLYTLSASMLMQSGELKPSEKALPFYRKLLEQEARDNHESGMDSDKALESYLMRDFRELFADDYKNVAVVLPVVAREFNAIVVGSQEVVNLVSGSLTPSTTCDLLTSLSLGEMELIFRHEGLKTASSGWDDKILSLIARSLQWDASDQHALWQIFSAELARHQNAVETLVPKLLQFAESASHPEVVMGVVQILSTSQPTVRLVGPLFRLPSTLWKSVCVSSLARWATLHPGMLGRSLERLLELSTGTNEAKEESDVKCELSSLLEVLVFWADCFEARAMRDDTWSDVMTRVLEGGRDLRATLDEMTKTKSDAKLVQLATRLTVKLGYGDVKKAEAEAGSKRVFSDTIATGEGNGHVKRAKTEGSD
mmetsp:Transcript_36323/g.81850  ORF Transcript_36323/g.81850 Transcript_36323/m.81850 type:complete len:1098 (-) Transcript_36323:36-3329(-)